MPQKTRFSTKSIQQPKINGASTSALLLLGVLATNSMAGYTPATNFPHGTQIFEKPCFSMSDYNNDFLRSDGKAVEFYVGAQNARSWQRTKPGATINFGGQTDAQGKPVIVTAPSASVVLKKDIAFCKKLTYAKGLDFPSFNNYGDYTSPVDGSIRQERSDLLLAANKSGPEPQNYKEFLTVNRGDVVRFMSYIHNNGAKGKDSINTRVRLEMPEVSASKQVPRLTLWSANAISDTSANSPDKHYISDTVHLNTADGRPIVLLPLHQYNASSGTMGTVMMVRNDPARNMIENNSIIYFLNIDQYRPLVSSLAGVPLTHYQDTKGARHVFDGDGTYQAGRIFESLLLTSARAVRPEPHTLPENFVLTNLTRNLSVSNGGTLELDGIQPGDDIRVAFSVKNIGNTGLTHFSGSLSLDSLLFDASGTQIMDFVSANVSGAHYDASRRSVVWEHSNMTVDAFNPPRPSMIYRNIGAEFLLRRDPLWWEGYQYTTNETADVTEDLDRASIRGYAQPNRNGESYRVVIDLKVRKGIPAVTSRVVSGNIITYGISMNVRQDAPARMPFQFTYGVPPASVSAGNGSSGIATDVRPW